MWHNQDIDDDMSDNVSAVGSVSFKFVFIVLTLPNYDHQIVAYWQTVYPPFRRSRFVELANLLMNVSSLLHLISENAHSNVIFSKESALAASYA